MTNENKTDSFILGGDALLDTKEVKKQAEKEQPQKPEKDEKWLDTAYRKYYQGNATNSLAQAIIFRQPPAQEQLELFTFEGREAFKTTLQLNKSFSLSFLDTKADKPLVLSSFAHKILDLGIIKFTEQVDHEIARAGGLQIKDLKVEIPLETIVRALGLNPSKGNIDHTRTKVNKALDELYYASIHYEKTDKKEVKGKNKRKDVGANDYLDSRIITKKGIANSVVYFTLAPDLGNYLGKSYVLNYPMRLLGVGTQQSDLAFFVGKILTQQNNIPRKGDDLPVIGVKTLLEKAIASSLLTDIETAKKEGHAQRRLIGALEKALNTLFESGVITDWGYTKGKRQKLTDTEKANASFDDMLNMYIFFEMPEASKAS